MRLFLHHVLCPQKLHGERLPVFAADGDSAPERTAAHISDFFGRFPHLFPDDRLGIAHRLRFGERQRLDFFDIHCIHLFHL